jgi:hypothetical protein
VKRFPLTRRTAIGVAVLAIVMVVGIAVVIWRASSIINPLLRAWAVQTVAEQSHGAYRLDLSRVHLNWLKRHVHVDSVHFTTDSRTNARLARPLSDVTVALYNCTISGVHLFTLAHGGGLVANSFGCRTGNVAVIVARPARDTTAAAPHPFLVFTKPLQLPRLLPRIAVSRVTFPALALDFRLLRAPRGETRLAMEQLQWSMADLVIDPADSSAAKRPLFSRSIDLLAENVVVHPDNATALRMGHLATNLSDWTLEARDVAYAPTLSPPEYARLSPYRRDYTTITAVRVQATGLDVGALARGNGTRARRVAVDSFRAEVATDQHRPPRVRVRRSPQDWLAALDQSLSIDSILLREGEIVYGENRPGHVRPGEVTFAHVQATAVNMHHLDGRRTRSDAMSLTATSQLQSVGRFDVQITIPLDAPRFEMTYRGTLGAMPATHLNRFVEEVFPWRIAKGQIGEIKFAVVVKNGVAVGTITPLYTDLSVDVTRRGSKGIVGIGGIVGHTVRGIASMAGDLQVHANNPNAPTKPRRTGTIHHVFAGQETLPGFLWVSLRDGMLLVIRD